MAVFNSLTFDGENSLDYGVYITGEAVYNAPERAVEMISIPGRNGAIALDQGRFENIEVTYPAGTFGDDQPEFASKIRTFRNALASRFNYIKLTDSYHPDEYRLGLYKSGLTTTPVQRSKAGEFPIVFNCKPQRFLTSGETEVDGNAWSNVQTGSGSIVTIDNADGDIGFKSLVANIEPIQSGSGTPAPTNVIPISGWDSVKVAKTGKNLLHVTATNATVNGVTFTFNADGSVTLNGTSTADNTFINLNYTAGKLEYPKDTPLKIIGGSSKVNVSVCGTAAPVRIGNSVSSTSPTTFTIASSRGDTATWARLYVPTNGTVFNNETIRPMIMFASEVDYTFEPFGTTKDIPLGRTVYKGTLDVVTGLLTVTHLGVDMGSLSWSYNATSQIHTAVMPADSVAVASVGDTGAICSSYERGDYPNNFANGKFCVCDSNLSTSKRIGVKNTDITDATAFTTAVTGQTLVYTLATPQTYQLTPEEVDLLLGTNNIWADSGDITVQYGKSPVYNPTEFDARPLIKVVGIGTTVVGDTAITITGTAGQTIYIDCDSMEIYKLNGGTPQSAASLVSFSGNDFPKLKAGSNTVALGTGITSVTIIPRWWII